MTPENDKDKEDPHYIGHRRRVKEKFLQVEPAGFNDYELLELLLFLAVPRKDVRPLAKLLLKKFGSLNKLIHAEPEQILEISGTTKNIVITFKILKDMIRRVLKHEIIKKHAISSWSALLDYLKYNMGNLKVEQFRIMFLNKRNLLIADEVIATGTIDQTPVYPREVVKKALHYEAGAIILVHNHPSGNPKPSEADISLTTAIVEACKSVNVKVHDHVIIGENDYYSFKTNLLL